MARSTGEYAWPGLSISSGPTGASGGWARNLGGVHEERMTQEHVAGRAGGGHDRSRRGRFEERAQLQEGHAVAARGGQQAGDVEMRADADPRGSVVFAHVGEQEQHEEGAVP